MSRYFNRNKTTSAKNASAKERVGALVKVIELNVDNELLGVSGAARKRQAAKKTGHKRSEIYKAEGGFKGFKDNLKKKQAAKKRKAARNKKSNKTSLRTRH